MPENIADHGGVKNDNSAQAMLDNIAASVVADAAWAALDVHDRQHDPATGAGTDRCPAWTRDRTVGTVPEDI